MRRIAALLALGVLFGACGGDEQQEAAAEACTDADYVRAGDVIGKPPKGFQVTPVQDEKALDGFMKQFEGVLGDRLRGYDSKVLFRRGAQLGTVVITVNARERTGDSDDFLRGAEDAAEKTGRPGETLVIAGEQGRLQQAEDGTYIAMAPAGSCAFLVMVAEREKMLRDSIAALPSR